MYGMACGFEMDNTAEYSGSSGTITIEDTSKYLSPYYAKIAANGYIYFTLSHTSDYVCIVHAHVKLGLSSHVKPIKLTRGGYEWSVAFDDTASEIRTITLKYSTGTFTYNYAIPAEKWISIILYVGYKNLGLYIDGSMVCDDHDNVYTGSAGSVTEIRCEAYTGSGSSLLYIDDIGEWFGSWKVGEICVVQPYIEEIDNYNELSLYPTSAQAAWTVVDEKAANDDTDYAYASGAVTKRATFGAKLAIVPGWTLKRVEQVGVLQRAKKTATGTGAETSVVFLKVGDTGDEYTCSTLTVTTSYSNKIAYVSTCYNGGFVPVSRFQNYESDDTIQIGLKITSTAGVDVRCTKIRCCTLGIFYSEPYKGGSSQEIVGSGSWDLSFDVDTSSWANTNYVLAYINALAYPLNGPDFDPTYDKLGVRLQYLTSYSAVILSVGAYKTGVVLPYESVSLGARRKFKLKFVGHDNFISVFESGVWIYTYAMQAITYPATMNLYLLSDIAATLTDVRASELADWREATYIDMSSSIASGISSVIQERPVEITPLQGGIVDFSYNRVRSGITPPNIYMHKIIKQNNTSAGSHYIVYFRDVGMVVDENYMDTDGYATRVLQLSSLDCGATQSASIIAQRGRENQERHNIQLAPDIRIEPGDKVTASYTLSATGTVISEDCIAESVSIEILEGSARMTIEGRQYV